LNYGKLAGLMVDDNSLKINELKVHLDALFNFASQVTYSQKHLLPVVQAGKSLIGINPNIPPKNLLKWLEGYVKEFSLVKEENIKEIKQKSPEVIEITKLGEMVNANQKTEALKYLQFLKQVANQEYIAEYLMELATSKSPFQLLFCWYIFKTIRHTENENQFLLLELGISCLMDENKNKNANQFELICYQNQILNTAMIRSETIIPKLNVMVEIAKTEISENDHTFILQELVPLINDRGEMGVWTFLSGLNMKELNPELILRLDAVRSAVRYSSNKNDWFMEKIINSQMKTVC